MRLNFVCDEALETKIRQRGDVSQSIRTALTRYYELLADARVRLRERFSAEDLTVIADLYNEQGQADEASLLEYLKPLNPTEHAALLDAVERYHQALRTGMKVDPASLLD